MTPTNEEYVIAAFLEAVTNDIDNRITWLALASASPDASLNGRLFDSNITAAIKAAEWLDNAVKNYRG